MKVICENREARHEYFIIEKYEAGISLDGGEVKSVRLGNVNLKDSFCSIGNGSIFLKNMHISVYDKSGAYNVREAKRDRRLLMHKSEIRKSCGSCLRLHGCFIRLSITRSMFLSNSSTKTSSIRINVTRAGTSLC